MISKRCSQEGGLAMDVEDLLVSLSLIGFQVRGYVGNTVLFLNFAFITFS